MNMIEFHSVTVQFTGVKALSQVDLNIEKGEVHVLVGENGAGKSTLIKLLSGVNTPTEGSILFDGHPFSPTTPHDAIKAGIRVVYQELNLLPYLSVAENIFFERLPRKHGLVDFKKLYADTEVHLQEVGLEVSPQTPVEHLSIAQMQLVEIAKALSSDSKVVVFDEPTASLTPKEIDRLFVLIKNLKKKGVTIIYISHRLQEFIEIGDRITILRNGTKVGTWGIRDLTTDEIVKQMIGKDIGSGYPYRNDVVPGEVVLSVQNLAYMGGPTAGVSFAVRRGEILGIGGLIGAGRTETMRALFGADPKRGGRVLLDGREITIDSPLDAVNHGICLLTEDRKNQGLILDMSCAANTTITNLLRVSRFGILDKSTEKKVSEQYVRELAIKTSSIDQLTRNLSGGNQQKIVLAKWLFRSARIIILDGPTRGIDVGAKFEIYTLIGELAATGKSVIIVSSEMPELLGICQRILVFSKGTLAGELHRSEFSQEAVLSLAYKAYLTDPRQTIGKDAPQ